LPYPLQDLPSGFLREIEIKKKKVRAGESGIPIHGFNKSHPLFAIIKYQEFKLEAGLL